MNNQAESTRERADYASRIRHQNERLAYGVAAFLMLTAALPVTQQDDQVGVLFAGALVLVLSVVWFRLVPATAFGDRRVMVFGILAQPCVVVLLAFTGGLQSEYFPFALLLVITTVFSPRAQHTVVVAAITALSVAVVAFVAPTSGSSALIADLSVWLLETVGFAALAAMIGRTLRQSRSAIAARADELDDLRGRAETRALTDTLTLLYNRRYADETLLRLIADAQRGRIFSIAAFDLDGFKRLNDSRGHAAGDEVLVDFARVLRAGLRGADVAVRMGGDEFMVLLPGTGLAQAILVAERLRAAVRAEHWGAPEAVVTASTGVVQWTDGQTAEDLLQGADRALYIAKRAFKAAEVGGPR